MIANPYQAYQRNSVLTASKEELTLMLYNGAIKFCNQTLEALEQKDIQKAHIYNIRVQDIVAELQATLDLQYDIAVELDALYTFIRELLIEANISKDSIKLTDAKELLVELRDVWQQAIKKIGIQEG